MKLTPNQRTTLFNMFGGLCAYCGEPLPEKGWHADHIEPIMREWWKHPVRAWHELVDGKVVLRTEKQKVGCLYPERDHIDNHFPACRACNIDKGACSLENWRKSLEQRVEVCRRNHSAFRHAERFKRVIVVTEPLVFYFEKLEPRAQTS
jgi:hypothetical protein